MVFIDALSVDMSQASGSGTLAFPIETNLQDLFFRYGVRINGNYVADVNCGYTPVYTGSVGSSHGSKCYLGLIRPSLPTMENT